MDGKDNIRKVGFLTVILFALSIFLSKSALNIFGTISFSLSLYYILRHQKNFFKKHVYLVILLVPIAAGLLLNLLSPEGFKGAFNFINRFKFILILIPLAVFIEEKQQFLLVLAALLLSGVIGSTYSLVYTKPPYFRALTSFMGMGRNADMLMSAVLFCVVFLFKYPLINRNQKLIVRSIIILLIGLFSVCVLLEASLGAWMGLLVGLITFAVFYERKLIVVLISLFVVFSFTPQFKLAKNEILTMFKFKKDLSTAVRLHMWKTGIDFIKDYPLYGTGKREPASYFLQYFEQQPEGYQKKYYYAIPYAGNFHNSYIQIMAEAGILTFILYMAAMFYILIQQFRRINEAPVAERCFIMASVVVAAGFLTAQMFHGELHSYGSYTLYIALFGGCFVLNQRVDWWRARSLNPASHTSEEMK